MQKFYKEWQFRHPSPDDFRYYFDFYLDEDLDWFFDNVFSSTASIDFGIKKLKNRFLVQNLGRFNVPYEIAYYNEDGDLELAVEGSQEHASLYRFVEKLNTEMSDSQKALIKEEMQLHLQIQTEIADLIEKFPYIDPKTKEKVAPENHPLSNITTTLTDVIFDESIPSTLTFAFELKESSSNG